MCILWKIAEEKRPAKIQASRLIEIHVVEARIAIL